MLPVQLQKSIDSGSISHAYLFTNRQLAFEFARALSPKAVDFYIVTPAVGKVHILTEDIERLQEEIKFKPFGDRRVVLIDGADSMQEAPQNKLLKTLEEPPQGTIMILYAERKNALLKTILSRCTEVACPDEELQFEREDYELAKVFYEKKMSGAQFFELKDIVQPIIDDKDGGRLRAVSFLNALESILRDELLQSLDSKKFGKAIMLTEETRKNIKQSYSVAYALKALALNI